MVYGIKVINLSPNDTSEVEINVQFLRVDDGCIAGICIVVYWNDCKSRLCGIISILFIDMGGGGLEVKPREDVSILWLL